MSTEPFKLGGTLPDLMEVQPALGRGRVALAQGQITYRLGPHPAPILTQPQLRQYGKVQTS